MSYFHTPPVVVGYDGSPSSRAALLAAAGEAARRDLHLLIVHAQETTGVLVNDRESADPLVDALHRVSPIVGRTRVMMRDRIGPAARVLCDQAEGAELLVVGRGDVGLMGWFAGSVAIDVLCGAPCPVLIVGDRAVHQPHDGPVVAGVDVEHADAVLEAAFREADLRRSELVVVHAGGGDAGTWLREVVEPYERKYPHVRVTEEPRAGRPAHVLLSTSADAGLIVVGTRGRGPVTGLIFGSVGQRLLRHAHCPVLVVR